MIVWSEKVKSQASSQIQLAMVLRLIREFLTRLMKFFCCLAIAFLIVFSLNQVFCLHNMFLSLFLFVFWKSNAALSSSVMSVNQNNTGFQGLLRNIERIEDATYFTSSLHLADASSFFGNGTNFVLAAKIDAKNQGYSNSSTYLSAVAENAYSWFANEEVFNSDKLKLMLKLVVEKPKGEMVLLLGPESIGKSHLLKNLASDYERVLYFDFRVDEDGDLLIGLATALKSCPFASAYDIVNQNWLKGILDIVSIKFRPSELLEIKYDKINLIKGINKVLQDKKVPKLTIIFDEVNKLFEKKDEPEINLLKKELSALFTFTKQTNRVITFVFTVLFPF
jgi:hypothetical protein